MSAAAPARVTLPPTSAAAAREAAEKTVGEDVVAGGEIMNQRTEVPSMAASRAVISPRPPGGEITTRVLDVGGVESVVDWREGFLRCCWCVRDVVIDEVGAKAFVNGKFVVDTVMLTMKNSVVAIILPQLPLFIGDILLSSISVVVERRGHVLQSVSSSLCFRNRKLAF